MILKLQVLAVVAFAALLATFVSRPDGSRLSARDLSEARGGDTKNSKCPKKCDENAGQYVECTNVGATCRFCFIEVEGEPTRPGGSVLGNPGQEGCDSTKGWRLDSPNTYDCGTLAVGTCAADSSSPTGFRCDGVDTGVACSTTGMIKVEPQAAPPFDP